MYRGPAGKRFAHRFERASLPTQAAAPMQPKPQNFWHVLRETVSNWNKHSATAHSAALAYLSLFSLAPILILAIAVSGWAFTSWAASGPFRPSRAWERTPTSSTPWSGAKAARRPRPCAARARRSRRRRERRADHRRRSAPTSSRASILTAFYVTRAGTRVSCFIRFVVTPSRRAFSLLGSVVPLPGIVVSAPEQVVNWERGVIPP